MDKELEIEYKSLVDKERFEELHMFFKGIAKKQEPFIQTNYYFDTKDYLLKRNKITLRIRQTPVLWELTVKYPVKGEKKLFSCKEEYTIHLTEQEGMEYLKEGKIGKRDIITLLLKDKLSLDDSVEFYLLGELVTQRTNYLFYNDVISLDKNNYNGKEDYEIEWETENHDFVLYMFNKLGLIPNSSKGKRNRFLKTLRKK